MANTVSNLYSVGLNNGNSASQIKILKSLITIDTKDSSIAIDAANPNGLSGLSCILLNLSYAYNNSHTLILESDTTEILNIPFPVASAYVPDGGDGYIDFSEVGKPLKLKFSISGTLASVVKFYANFTYDHSYLFKSR
jgi:hypothetical protein